MTPAPPQNGRGAPWAPARTTARGQQPGRVRRMEREAGRPGSEAPQKVWGWCRGWRLLGAGIARGAVEPSGLSRLSIRTPTSVFDTRLSATPPVHARLVRRGGNACGQGGKAAALSTGIALCATPEMSSHAGRGRSLPTGSTEDYATFVSRCHTWQAALCRPDRTRRAPVQPWT